MFLLCSIYFPVARRGRQPWTCKWGHPTEPSAPATTARHVLSGQHFVQRSIHGCHEGWCLVLHCCAGYILACWLVHACASLLVLLFTFSLVWNCFKFSVNSKLFIMFSISSSKSLKRDNFHVLFFSFPQFSHDLLNYYPLSYSPLLLCLPFLSPNWFGNHVSID